MFIADQLFLVLVFFEGFIMKSSDGWLVGCTSVYSVGGDV